MKNHEYYEELVNLKVDEMLTAAQQAELNAHLETCPECQERLELYLAVQTLSDDLLLDPPEHFTGSVMARVSLEKKRLPGKHRIPARILTFAGAAAAIALLLFTGPLKTLIQQPQNMLMAEKATGEAAAPQATLALDFARDDESAPVDTDGTSAAMEEPKGSEEDKNSSAGLSGDSGEYGMLGSVPRSKNLFDPAATKVGDEVVGFRLAEIEATYSENDRNVRAVFDGEATLSGTLYFDNNENGHWGKFIYYYVDDDASELLPYPIDDDRQVWFGIDNYEEAVKMLDVQPEDEGNTVAYHAIIVIDQYTVLQGSSEGCNFATLDSIVSITRLSD